MTSLLSPCAVPPCDPIIQSHPVNESGASRREEGKRKQAQSPGRERTMLAMQRRYAATPSPAPSSGKTQLSGAATHHFLQLFDFRSRPTEYAPLLYLYKSINVQTQKNHYPHESTSTAYETTETDTYKDENMPSRRSVCGDRYTTQSQVHSTFGNGRGTILGPPSLFQVLNGRDREEKWRCSCTMGTLRTRRSSSRLRRLVSPNGNITPGA